MIAPVSQIPEGTPVLNLDGTQIIARFKFLQGKVIGDDRFINWNKMPGPMKPMSYATEVASYDMELNRLTARRLFHAPAMQVWQAEFSLEDTDPADYPLYFPPSMFLPSPDANQDMKVASAIETVLGDPQASNALKVYGGGSAQAILDDFQSLADFRRSRGTARLG